MGDFARESSADARTESGIVVCDQMQHRLCLFLGFFCYLHFIVYEGLHSIDNLVLLFFISELKFLDWFV